MTINDPFWTEKTQLNAKFKNAFLYKSWIFSQILQSKLFDKSILASDGSGCGCGCCCCCCLLFGCSVVVWWLLFGCFGCCFGCCVVVVWVVWVFVVDWVVVVVVVVDVWVVVGDNYCC